jgi:hypothetical protein
MLTARRIAATIAVAAAMFAPVAWAAPIYFDATLSGAAENPPVVSPGFGTATVILDPVAHTMRVIVSFSDLVGTTTAAHVHCCTAPPNNAGVATQTPSFLGFPLGVTAGTYDSTFDTTLTSTFSASFLNNNGGTPAAAEAALFAGLLAGNAYFNIHTSFRLGGEIRGFLVQRVPEPSTVLLVGLGMLVLTLASRRRFVPIRR